MYLNWCKTAKNVNAETVKVKLGLYHFRSFSVHTKELTKTR